MRDLQASFAGGEWCPALYGRVDIAKYKSALRVGRNFNILPQGGARNRPGTAYIAAAGDSTRSVRLIAFIASTSSAYIVELGHLYARFYTLDAQVQSGGSYQIATPYSGTDLFGIKVAQSADVLYLAHPNYAPQVLTFFSSTNWTLAAYPFQNGPYMLENSDITSTITPSGTTGSITLTAAKNLFFAGHVNSLWQLLATIPANTITPAISTSVINFIPTKATWQANTSGTWSGSILIQTSPDNITWTTVSTVTSNGTVSGTASFTDGYLRAIMQSALAFSGTATVALTGNGDSTGATIISALSAATAAVPAGDTAKITLTSLSGTGDTVLLQRSDDAGATWSTLATYTTNQAGVSVATTKTACLIRAQKTVDGGGSPVATVDGTTGAAPTRSVAISTASVSQAIQCGQVWSVITAGTSWTGKLRVEISTDRGTNWSLVQSIFAGTTGSNFNETGQTGVRQCLLRISADPTVTFTGTCTIDLTSQNFDWEGVVKVTAYTSPTQVTATVQGISNNDNSGLANTSSTWQWSEGAWSTYRGFPSAVTFYQDRAVWGGPEPANVYFTQTAAYTDFGTSDPIVDSDGINVVLNSRQLNAVQSLIGMPQFLLALTSDSEFGIGPGTGGVLSPTSIQQELFGHRGSAAIDPVIVGNELILIQQMGTVVRNLIFQLAVNGFFGDNISIASQHLFTGYSIKEMAYQQEPDSIIWAVRSDGALLSCTYQRDQEMQAWTRHDTLGTFESVACIPNTTLGLNEIWFVVNRNGTRYIEALKPRDQGTVPSAQWFMDCAVQYNGVASNVITGLSHLNGKNVSVLADGFVLANPANPIYPTVTVSGGQITLPASYAGSVVTVGLPYVSDLGTLDAEIPNQEGSLQARRVKYPRAKLRLWNSRGGYISTVDPATSTGILDVNGGKFVELTAQDAPGGGPDQSFNFDTPLPLFTGIIGDALPSGFDYGAHINVRQVDPLPLCVLDIISVAVPGEF